MLTHHLHQLILKIWDREEMPVDLIAIFKKGDKPECGNYQGIFLPSTTGKIVAQILTSHFLPLVEEIPQKANSVFTQTGHNGQIFTT